MVQMGEMEVSECKNRGDLATMALWAYYQQPAPQIIV